MVNDTIPFRARRHERWSGGKVFIVICAGLNHQTLTEANRLSESTNGGAIFISDGSSNHTTSYEDDISNLAFSLSCYNQPTRNQEEAIIVPHVNGDLSYLYRPPVLCRHIKRPKRHVIHQPCWRRNRWKSLT